MSRRLIAIIGFLFWGSLNSWCQSFPIEIVLDNGSSDNHIDLVFLSDGYQVSELPKFILDVKKITNDIFRQSPFLQYKNYFNVIAIKVPSIQSGASHPSTTPECSTFPVAVVDNYFGSSFDSNNIHRLLVPKSTKIGTVLGGSYPNYDQVFVLVNSPMYGGSGGVFATSSTEASASEISIHEIGHSFAGLADEYWAGEQYAVERANQTQESKPSQIKWKNWLGTNLIGIYPQDGAPTWYRPHPDCKMRTLGMAFCSVCIQGFVERIENITNPILTYSPSVTKVDLAASLPFSISLLQPEPATVRSIWKINGSVVATNKSAITVPKALLVKKENEVQVDVVDTTAFLRSDNRLLAYLHVVKWAVTNPDGISIPDPVTGLEIVPTESHYRIEAYPNPVSDKLHVSYTLSKSSFVQLGLTDILGRTVKNVVSGEQAAGVYSYDLGVENFNSEGLGFYVMRLEIDGSVITKKIVVK